MFTVRTSSDGDGGPSVNVQYPDNVADGTMYTQPGTETMGYAGGSNIKYVPLEQRGGPESGPQLKFPMVTSMSADERSYVSLLADIATIGRPEIDPHGTLVLQTETGARSGQDSAGLSYTERNVVSLPPVSADLAYGDISLRQPNQLANSLGQYQNVTYITEQSTMQVEQGPTGGDVGNVIILQSSIEQSDEVKSDQSQTGAVSGATAVENTVILNEELQDAVATISNTGTVLMHPLTFVAMQEEAMAASDNEYEEERTVAITAAGPDGDIVLNMPMKPLKTKGRRHRTKKRKVSEKTVNPSSPRVQKFTADELTDMGTTEKEILVNILEQSRKRSGRKPKLDKLKPPMAEANEAQTDSVNTAQIAQNSEHEISSTVVEPKNQDANAPLTTKVTVTCNGSTTHAEVTCNVIANRKENIDSDQKISSEIDVASETCNKPDGMTENVTKCDNESEKQLPLSESEQGKEIETVACDSVSDDKSIEAKEESEKPLRAASVYKIAKFEEIQTRSKRKMQNPDDKNAQSVGNSRGCKKIKLADSCDTDDSERQLVNVKGRRTRSAEKDACGSNEVSDSKTNASGKLQKVGNKNSSISKSSGHTAATDELAHELGDKIKKVGGSFKRNSNMKQNSIQKRGPARKGVTDKTSESIDKHASDNAIDESDAIDDDEAVGDDLDGRCTDVLHKQFDYPDRCVIRLPPVVASMLKNKNLVVELDVSDSLEVGQLEKNLLPDGMNRFSFCVSFCKDNEMEEVIDDLCQVECADSELASSSSCKTVSSKIGDEKSSKTLNKSRRGRRSKLRNKSKDAVNQKSSKSADLNNDSKTDEEKQKEDGSKVLETSVDGSGMEVNDNSDNGKEEMENTEMHTEDMKDELNEETNTAGEFVNDEFDLLTSDASEKTAGEKSEKEDIDDTGIKVESGVRRRKKSKKVEKEVKKKVIAHKNYTVRVNDDGQKEYCCPLCSYVSKYSQNVNIHVQEHSGEKTIMCEECGTWWKSKARLHRHMVVHQRDRPFSCPLCKVTFKRRTVYSCVVCSHETTVRQNMIVHTYQHTDERPYQCEVCGQTFKGPSNLCTHKRQHSTELNYHCTMCDSRFRDRGTYKQHMRRHLGDKRHVCEHCGKSFVISSDLKKHIRIHTGEKPYVCSVCGKSFSDGSGLTRHRNLHVRRFRYECGLCSKQFSRTDLCTYHIKNTHPDSSPVVVKKISVEADLPSRPGVGVSDVSSKSGPANRETAAPTSASEDEGSSKNSVQYKKTVTWQDFEILTAEASRRIVKSGSSRTDVQIDGQMLSSSVYQFPVASDPMTSSIDPGVKVPVYDNTRQYSYPPVYEPQNEAMSGNIRY